MEIWFKTDSRNVRLPILPSEMMIDNGTVENSLNLLGNGEASIYAGNKVNQGEISSFFPATKNENSYKSFIQYSNYAEPYFFVSILRDWMFSGQVVRFVVTPNIVSFPVRIVSFTYGEKDGSGDVYYTIKWKEVREITIKKISNNNSNSNNNNERPPSQTQDKNEANKQRIHKVKKGEHLYGLAQKYYGKGSDYPKIKKANESKYPKLKNSNVIYVNWELVIP